MMQRTIRSYVPERAMLDGKERTACRRFAEDVALLEASDRALTLASRGPDLPVGESFWDLVPTSNEQREFVFGALATHTRVLFSSKRGPVLLFADVATTAQRLLAVLPYVRMQELVGILTLLGRRDICLPCSDVGCTACAPSVEASLAIAELLFDVDRIFNNQRVRSFSDYCRLISEFGGCAPALRPSNPSAMPTTPRDMDRTAMAYLEACLNRR